MLGDKLVGKIDSWNDDKGFGFISCEELNERIFFHISSYRPSDRPIIGKKVVFILGKDNKGKKQAQQVQEWQFAYQKELDQMQFSIGKTYKLIFVLAFYAALFILLALSKLKIYMPMWFLFLGILTFLVYWKDKAASKKGSWRTPEATLHIYSLLGGWGGAILAQTYLRHKSQKKSFKVMNYLSVILNLSVIALIVIKYQ